MMNGYVQRAITCFTLLLCLVSFSSCGYFLYPERRGQTKGEIDLPVLILDCVGLFFFIIPGVAALAVDFSSGAIYLPNKKTATLDVDVVRFDKERAHDPSYLDSLISKHTGEDVRLSHESVKWIRTEEKSKERIEEVLKHLNSHIDDYVSQSQLKGTS